MSEVLLLKASLEVLTTLSFLQASLNQFLLNDAYFVLETTKTCLKSDTDCTEHMSPVET